MAAAGRPAETPSLTISAMLGRGTSSISSIVGSSLALAGDPAAPLRGLRKLVSGSKQRFQCDGFDLDLTYVLPQLIALGLPASGLIEPLYRNPLSQVRAFLDRYHGSGGYTIINLCNERDYSDTDFPSASSVLRFPSEDHHAPPLEQILAFCEAAHMALTGSPGPPPLSPGEFAPSTPRRSAVSERDPSPSVLELESPLPPVEWGDAPGHEHDHVGDLSPCAPGSDPLTAALALRDAAEPTAVAWAELGLAEPAGGEVGAVPETMGAWQAEGEPPAAGAWEAPAGATHGDDGAWEWLAPAGHLPVLAVHCKAGKGRTGVMLAAYLMWASDHSSADGDSALAFFRRVRTSDGDAVVNPSQVRYVRHFASLLRTRPSDRPALLRGTPIRVIAVGISGAPAAARPPTRGPAGGLAGYSYTDAASAAASALFAALNGSSSPWILQLRLCAVETRRQPDGAGAYIVPVGLSQPRPCAPGTDEEALFELPGGGVDVASEVLLSLRALGGLSSGGDEMGWLHLHTSFLQPEQPAHVPAAGPLCAPGQQPMCSAVFGKRDVDLIERDSRFPGGWWLRLYYTPRA